MNDEAIVNLTAAVELLQKTIAQSPNQNTASQQGLPSTGVSEIVEGFKSLKNELTELRGDLNVKSFVDKLSSNLEVSEKELKKIRNGQIIQTESTKEAQAVSTKLLKNIDESLKGLKENLNREVFGTIKNEIQAKQKQFEQSSEGRTYLSEKTQVNQQADMWRSATKKGLFAALGLSEVADKVATAWEETVMKGLDAKYSESAAKVKSIEEDYKKLDQRIKKERLKEKGLTGKQVEQGVAAYEAGDSITPESILNSPEELAEGYTVEVINGNKIYKGRDGNIVTKSEAEAGIKSKNANTLDEVKSNSKESVIDTESLVANNDEPTLVSIVDFNEEAIKKFAQMFRNATLINEKATKPLTNELSINEKATKPLTNELSINEKATKPLTNELGLTVPLTKPDVNPVETDQFKELIEIDLDKLKKFINEELTRILKNMGITLEEQDRILKKQKIVSEGGVVDMKHEQNLLIQGAAELRDAARAAAGTIANSSGGPSGRYIDTKSNVIEKKAEKPIGGEQISMEEGLAGETVSSAGIADLSLLFLAKGGEVDESKPIIVGEEGPELFVPSSNGNIIPNDKLGSVAGTSATQRTASFNQNKVKSNNNKVEASPSNTLSNNKVEASPSNTLSYISNTSTTETDSNDLLQTINQTLMDISSKLVISNDKPSSSSVNSTVTAGGTNNSSTITVNAVGNPITNARLKTDNMLYNRRSVA